MTEPADPPKFILPSDAAAPKPAGVNPDVTPFVLPSEANKQPSPTEAAVAASVPVGDQQEETVSLGRGAEMTVPKRKPPAPYEDLPTLAALGPEIDKLPPTARAALTFGPAFAESLEGKKNILKTHLPGATFENDKYGNPLVVHEGKKYHIARPDSFNAQSVGETIMQTVPGVAASTAVLASGPPGWVAAPLLFGAGYGSKQGRDYVARQAGSGEEADPLSLSSIVEGGINAVAPYASKIARTASGVAGDVGSTISAGVKRVLDSREAARKALTTTHPDDLGFHALPDNAADLVRRRPYSPISENVEAAATAHAEAAPARIAQGLDNTFGTADANIAKEIATVKGPANQELTTALSQAKPIDIAPLIANIDAEINASATNSARRAALEKLKKTLTLQEGTTGTPATRVVDPNTVPGRPQIWREVPGQPGTPPQYVSDARQLNDIKREFTQLLTYGDKANGIPPGSISAADHAVGNIRQSLSQILNDNVPGYADLMKKYGNAYQMHDAYEMGQKIMLGGKNALDMERITPFLEGSPHEKAAFRIGVRDAIDGVIRQAADGKDVQAIKKILSGENSYRREILNELYGKEAVDKMAEMAEREGGYAIANQKMIDAAHQGRAIAGITRAGKIDEPVTPNVRPDQTLWATLAGAGTKAINWATSHLYGARGQEFERNVAGSLTGPGKKMLEDIIERTKPDLATTVPVTAIPPAIAESGQPRRRQGHAAGGQVKAKCDHAACAARLVSRADKIRRGHARHTKVLLNAPDDAVAKALAIAGRGL